MASGRVWRLNGVARCLVGGVGRAGSSLPLDFQANTPAPDLSFGFPHFRRLTKGSEIEEVVEKGKQFRTSHLDVRMNASSFGHSRVGIVVPKHGHTAVERNRLKRRLRELVRIRILHQLGMIDVVIRARSEAYAASFAILAAEVDDLCSRLPQIFPHR